MNSFTNLSLSLNWTAALPNGDALLSHEVEICLTANPFTCAVATVGANNQASLPSDDESVAPLLVAGSAFTVRIRAKNALGYGPWSVFGSAQTAARPDTPAPLAFGTGIDGLSTYTSIHVAWAPPNSHGKHISSYELNILYLDSATPASTVTLNGDDSQFVLADVPPGQACNFTLRARNEYGWSDWSLPSTLATYKTVPATPEVPTFTVFMEQSQTADYLGYMSMETYQDGAAV